MSSISDLPAFPPASLTKEQAEKLAQIAKEAREKHDVTLYNHSVTVNADSEGVKKLEQELEPEFKYLKEIAKKVFGGEDE